MITLTRVDITNVRAIGHATFEPLTDGGFTAINGANGVGKSSLLLAVVWALYGVTPEGIPVAGLRRQQSVGECKVVVAFEHDGQSITVERGLKGTRDATYVKITLGGVEQSFGKVRAANDWVTQRLGLDAEGFLTAFVVRQKEIDALVRAKPAERKRLIERLAGIDRMSAAIKAARDTEADLRRALDHIPGSTEDVTAARDALEAAQREAEQAWEIYDAAAAAASEASAVLTDRERDHSDLADRMTAHGRAAEQVQATHRDVLVATERRDAAVRERDRCAAEAIGGDPAAVTAAEEHLNTLRGTITAAEAATHRVALLVAERNAAQAASRAADTAVEQASARASAAQGAVEAAQTRLQGLPADLDARAAVAAEAADVARTRVADLRAEHARLTNALTALTATTTADCPTCSTHLPDSTALVTSMRASLDRIMTVDGPAARDALTEAEATLAGVQEQQRIAAQIRDALPGLVDQQRTDQAALDSARDTAAEASRAVTEATAAAAAAADASRDAVAAADDARRRLPGAEEALTAARAARAAAAALAGREAAVDAADDALAHAQAVHDRAAAAEEAARVPETERTQVQDAYRAALDAVRAAEQAAHTAETAHKVAAERTRFAEKTRDDEEEKLAKRIATIAELERATATKDALAAFRGHRIASLAPELSEIASTTLPRMTSGRFVSLDLDDDFTPHVTDDSGVRRPATWLSGGEESAVALALRLAIGEVIAGGSGGLLWMDEPQTAMDAQNRPAMMAVIRELPGRQPIIISHAAEATDMADLVVDMVPDPEAGSTLTEHAAAQVVEFAALG